MKEQNAVVDYVCGILQHSALCSHPKLKQENHRIISNEKKNCPNDDGLLWFHARHVYDGRHNYYLHVASSAPPSSSSSCQMRNNNKFVHVDSDELE